MNVEFCDRCKKRIEKGEITDSLKIEKGYSPNMITTSLLNHIAMDKNICKNCTNDIMNIIDYECDRFKLDTMVTVSKEANQNDV